MPLHCQFAHGHSFPCVVDTAHLIVWASHDYVIITIKTELACPELTEWHVIGTNDQRAHTIHTATHRINRMRIAGSLQRRVVSELYNTIVS